MSLPLLTATGLLAACVLDRCLGEPGRWHPLVGFGRLAAGIESLLNRPGKAGVGGHPLAQRLRGLLALLLGPADRAVALGAVAAAVWWPGGHVCLWGTRVLCALLGSGVVQSGTAPERN